MNDSRVFTGVVVLIAALLGVAGWFAWQRAQHPAGPVTSPTAPAAEASTAAATPPPAPEPGIQHPVEAAPAAVAASGAGPAALPALDASDAQLRAAMTDLIGTKAVVTWLLTDGFARRVVATVDNLGRSQATPRLWPVKPIEGRFTVEPAGAPSAVVAAANRMRYAAFVRLVESVDANRAAMLYLRHYALFQQAYEELGYPRGYFNDRLVTVIDLLLATPSPTDPVEVRLTEVKGPIASERPWVRYEFADPALESMPIGAKILARLGDDQSRRVKAKLAEFRRAITRR